MYQKVLAPLDGSELAECALVHVRSLIEHGLAKEVTLLNIIRLERSLAEYDLRVLREHAFAAANKYLAGIQSKFLSEALGIKAESLAANWVAGAITEYAQKNGMDLIVMSTHGYTGFKKMMLGSVALGVLNHSAVPVLLIRSESCGV